jgi:hypothetical protein
LLKRFSKGAALAAIEIQHRHVLRHAGKGLADHLLRDAGGCGFSSHALHKGVEVAAAAGGECRGGGDGGEENGQAKYAHANPLCPMDGIMP